MRYSIGIDTGGTFTDLVLADSEAGRWTYHKVPTRTADPAQGILDGIAEIMQIANVKPAEVGFLVLGTTLATNAVLEGKWAPTGLITTHGFRDVLSLARQRRPHYFNLDIQKPVPPVTPDATFEVTERLSASGEVVKTLDEAEVLQAIRGVVGSGVKTVAVCFLHAYQSGAHERRVRELIQRECPGVFVSLSSEVLPEFREYERFVTTVVNASLLPVMDEYLQRFEMGVRDLGVQSAAHVMQSNGGAVTANTVRQRPINTFFSGPAGGAIGTVALGEQTGVKNLITFDMGGTSTDVCLIRNGQPAMKNEREMGGFPVRTRTLDIHTIGAGGGSLAWIDAGGMLKVGPASASAYPGPAAYGRGGTRPTVTDANVVLGRLSPTSLLGGRMSMYPEKALAALKEHLCGALDRDPHAVAQGIIEIANANMTGAVRVISVEQGEDPRAFALVAFGGAGPLHAVDVATMAGMHHVIVPPRPGLLSAQGLLQADRRGDFSLTRLVPGTPAALASINAGLRELSERSNQWLKGEGATSDSAGVVHRWQVDLRYAGQNSELIMDIERDSLDAAALAAAIEAFHQRHKSLYGYDMRARGIEVVHLRVSVIISRDRIAAPTVEGSTGAALQAFPDAVTREVWYPETGFVRTPVVQREHLPPGSVMPGHAIVEQMDSTTVIPPNAITRVDEGGYLHINLPKQEKESAQ